jgi:hypothetical protein
MTITELINRLQELKSIHGDLQVCVEDNSRPLAFLEHWVDKVEVYSDTGVFQDFKYCYIIMDDDSDIIDDYLKKRGKRLLPSKIVDYDNN